MVAVVGGCSPAWLFHHLDAKSYGRALTTALAGAVCFCVTIYGSMGGITGSSDKVAAERARAADATKDDHSELVRIAADRARLPAFRPIGTVEADLATARAGHAYKSSASCAPEHISSRSVREGCDAFRKLEGELETGKAAARLDQAAIAIRGRLATDAAIQTVDPGATAVSRIVGTSADNVAAWSALFGSLALELAGMIAMMRAESQHVASPKTGPETRVHAASTELDTSRAPDLVRISNSTGKADTVGRFMLSCLKRMPGEEAPGGAIYVRYRCWCTEQQPALTALDAHQFALQFAERCERVGIRTRHHGRKVYCVDVRLVG
jgi:hypothetical protein